MSTIKSIFALVMGIMGLACYFIAGQETQINNNVWLGAVIGTMALGLCAGTLYLNSNKKPS